MLVVSCLYCSSCCHTKVVFVCLFLLLVCPVFNRVVYVPNKGKEDVLEFVWAVL